MKNFKEKQLPLHQKFHDFCVDVVMCVTSADVTNDLQSLFGMATHVTPTGINKKLQSLFDMTTHVMPGGGQFKAP